MEPDLEHPASGAFDVVVLGTGLVESLVAAAAAKAGKTVLHIDHEAHYGAEWASFGAAALDDWLAAGDAAVAAFAEREDTSGAGPLHEVTVHAAAAVRRRCVDVSFVGTDAAPASLRGFSIDLAGPKIIYCNGSLVDVLLRSGAHSYVEFKAVECVALFADGCLRAVPGNRADVFTSTQLSAADKRALMRALKAAAEEMGEGQQKEQAVAASLFPDPDASFDAALEAAGLNDTLRAAVIHALCMLDTRHDVSVAQGLAALRRYMSSLGRYTGAGAFLLPLYGTSELPQAFCRSAAVSGATYVLRHQVDAIVTDPQSHRVTGIRLAGGQLIHCTALAAHGAYLDAFMRSDGDGERPARRLTHRCVCITDASLMQSTQQQILAVVPPGAVPGSTLTCAVRVVQFGHSSCVVPEGRFVVYLSVHADPAVCSARDALWPTVSALMDTHSTDGGDRGQVKPRLLYAVFSTHVHEHPAEQAAHGLPENVALCRGAGDEPDMCASVGFAEQAFARLFPDGVFFPQPESGAHDLGDDSDDETERQLLQAVADV